MLEACLLQKQTSLYMMDGKINRQLLGQRLADLDNLYKADSMMCEMVRALLSIDEENRMYPHEYLSLFNPFAISYDRSSLLAFNDPHTDDMTAPDQPSAILPLEHAHWPADAYPNEDDETGQPFSLQLQECEYNEYSQLESRGLVQNQNEQQRYATNGSLNKDDDENWYGDLEKSKDDNLYATEEPLRREEPTTAVEDEPQIFEWAVERDIPDSQPFASSEIHNEYKLHTNGQNPHRAIHSFVEYKQSPEVSLPQHHLQPLPQPPTPELVTTMRYSTNPPSSTKVFVDRKPSESQPSLQIRSHEPIVIRSTTQNTQTIPIHGIIEHPAQLTTALQNPSHQHSKHHYSQSEFRSTFPIPNPVNPVSYSSISIHGFTAQPIQISPGHRTPKDQCQTSPIKGENSNIKIQTPEIQQPQLIQAPKREQRASAVHQESRPQSFSQATPQQSSTSFLKQDPVRPAPQSFSATHEPVSATHEPVKLEPQNQMRPSVKQVVPPRPVTSFPQPSDQTPSAPANQLQSISQPIVKTLHSQTPPAPIRPLQKENPEQKVLPDHVREIKHQKPNILRQSAPLAKVFAPERPLARGGKQINSYTKQYPVETKIVGSKTFVVFVERGPDSSETAKLTGQKMAGVRLQNNHLTAIKNRLATGTNAATIYK